MTRVLPRSCLALLSIGFCCSLTAGPARGQFTTILNIPPDPDIGDNKSIGSNTQLNLFDGGKVGFF